MACGLNRKIDTDKVLRDKAFKNAKNLKYDGYQRGRTCFNVL